ncbi:MAG: molybdopterin-binding protein, partial [Candidatus Paceibacterota bacterium]
MSEKSTPLIAEVISIGDEMTSGARLDTNSQWLSQQLALLGIRTEFHTTVGDRFQANVQVFRTAATRADVIVSTGGLGPTQDDLTREAVAAATDRPLEFRQSAFDHIASLFSNRGRLMPEQNRIQAMFPRGSREIPNPQGTAPGIDLQWPHPRSAGSDEEAAPTGVPRLFALPGVPAEMRQMWTGTVVPRLIEEMGAGRRKIHQHVVKCFGLGESEMERRLDGLIARDQIPNVGITVSQATISLRITAEEDDDAICESMIAATRERIIQSAGEFV